MYLLPSDEQTDSVEEYRAAWKVAAKKAESLFPGYKVVAVNNPGLWLRAPHVGDTTLMLSRHAVRAMLKKPNAADKEGARIALKRDAERTKTNLKIEKAKKLGLANFPKVGNKVEVKVHGRWLTKKVVSVASGDDDRGFDMGFRVYVGNFSHFFTAKGYGNQWRKAPK